MLNTAYQPHSYSYGILAMIHNFVPGRAGVSPQEADAWFEDIRALGASGDYFFSLNRYLFGATRP